MVLPRWVKGVRAPRVPRTRRRCRASGNFIAGPVELEARLLLTAAPTLSSIGPTSAAAGAPDTMITAMGSGFEQGATVDFNGAPLATTYVSANTLTATLPASDLTTAGRNLMIVVNPGGGGGNSAPQLFTVLPTVQFDSASKAVNASVGYLYVPLSVRGERMTPTVTQFTTAVSAPTADVFDAAGNLYVTDYNSGTIQKVTPTGVVSTFASGLHDPLTLAIDASGNLYVSDTGAGTIDRVSPDGSVSTFASGLDHPGALAINAAGDLFVVTDRSVSEVAPDGSVSTFASGFLQPDSIAVDASGNLYVGDAGTNAISKVTPDGSVSTFVSGFPSPTALAFDHAGNLYVLDRGRLSVFIVTPGGSVRTVASNVYGFDIAVDAADRAFVANPQDSEITEVTPAGPAISVPFSLGGTAVAGTDYSAISPSPLTIGAGEDSAVITGLLLPDAGSDKTLTLTLGTPVGAVLGSPATNTVTIAEPAYPSPALASVDPTALPDGSAGATIAVNGSGFVSDATVDLNGHALATTYVSSTELTAEIPASDLAMAEYDAVTVVDPGPHGGTSGARTFAVTYPAPSVSGVTPTSARAGSLDSTITATGSGFVTASTVEFNGQPLATTYVSPTELTAEIPASDLAVAGQDTLTVVNPAPGGGTSAGKFFSVAATVQFANGAETVAATAGTFSVPVTVTGERTAPSVRNLTDGIANPSFNAFDAAGNLYVANPSSGTVSKVTPDGVTTIFASGFSDPSGLAFDTAGNLYVANEGNGNISKVTPDGAVSTFASGFVGPAGLAFDSQGNLYVANYNGGDISVVTPAGVASTYVSRTVGYSLFAHPDGVAFDQAGNLYFSDAGTGVIYQVQPGGKAYVFATGFRQPSALAFDAASDLYVAAGINVVKRTPGGVLRTVYSDQTSGPVGSASLTSGLAFDAAGNLYVSSMGNAEVEKVSLDGAAGVFASGIIARTVAVDAAGNVYVANGVGNGTIEELLPGGGARVFASGFVEPAALAFDTAGNLYVADTMTGTVSKVTPGGSVQVFASGLVNPEIITVDAVGNVYVNSGNEISKVAPDGSVSTLATDLGDITAMTARGTDLYVVSDARGAVFQIAPSGAATEYDPQLGAPTDLAFDSAGDLFVDDYNANRGGPVEEVAPDGVVTTIDTGLPYLGPIAVDGAGNVYVVNNLADTVTEITPAGPDVSVSFALGGTASAGTDYSGVTSSPLTFAAGAATAAITGTLQADAEGNKTLTFTLWAPNGAVLGSPAGNTLTIEEPSPAPTLTGISPNSAPAGGSAMTITVAGSGFVAGSTVDFNGQALATTYVNGGTLSATIPASDLATAGSAQVTVVSPGPGGGTSAAQTFTIRAVSLSERVGLAFQTANAAIVQAFQSNLSASAISSVINSQMNGLSRQIAAVLVQEPYVATLIQSQVATDTFILDMVASEFGSSGNLGAALAQDVLSEEELNALYDVEGF